MRPRRPTCSTSSLPVYPELRAACPAPTNLSNRLPLLSFQSLSTIKFSKSFVLITIQNAGGCAYPPLPHTSSLLQSSLECAVPRFRMLSPLECAVTRKGGGGCPVPAFRLRRNPILLPSSPLFSKSCTLFCGTVARQLSWNQTLPNSFHRHVGSVPPSPLFAASATPFFL